jgi:hypothetical protein
VLHELGRSLKRDMIELRQLIIPTVDGTWTRGALPPVQDPKEDTKERVRRSRRARREGAGLASGSGAPSPTAREARQARRFAAGAQHQLAGEQMCQDGEPHNGLVAPSAQG